MALVAEQVAAAPLVGGESTSLHSHTVEAFPVGGVFLAVVNTNPNTLLGYGTWSQIAGGRVLVGQTGGDTDFDVPEEIGGAKSINLQHGHGAGPLTISLITGTRKSGTAGQATLTDSHAHGVSGLTDSQLGTAQSIMNPYFVVYIWKRTA